MFDKKRQRGSISIEFALLFSVFFVVLYAIIAYSIPFLLMLSLRHTAAEAAHAVIKVDPYLSEAIYSQRISEQISGTVNGTLAGSKTWFPTSWRSGGCPAPKHKPTLNPKPDDAPQPNPIQWKKIPGNPSFGWYSYNERGNINTPRHQIYVCLQRKYNPSGAVNEVAIVPYLYLLGLTIPSFPKDASGDTVFKGEAYITHL